MYGSFNLKISNSRAAYRFTLTRNITIVCGDSGTGKTTLYEMIAEHARFGAASGVSVSAAVPCVALTDSDWKAQLAAFQGSIVFIDEGAQFLSSREFAAAVKASDNYYVIFNRESLHELPYSVEEIYEIRHSGRYHTFKKIYKRTADLTYAKARAGTAE